MREMREVEREGTAEVLETAEYLKITYSLKFYMIVAKQILLLMGRGNVVNARPQLLPRKA